MIKMALKPCPFCGETPIVPLYAGGSDYSIDCTCGMATACVQICDTMTIEERCSESMVGYYHEAQYVNRATKEVITQWNRRRDQALYNVLSFLQTTPTEDFDSAEQYRKYLYREIMEWN